MSKVTITHIAEALGVSKASVSYALNGRPGVSEATRERVLDLARELGWHPSSSARALSRSRSDAIGMVIKRDPDLLGNEPYYMRLLEGVEDVLSRANQSLLLRMVGTTPGRDVEVYERWSAERRVDGVIVLDRAVEDPRPAMLDKLGLPYVLHGVLPTDDPTITVIEDQHRDAEMIVHHLGQLGHRNIVHVTGPLFLVHEVDRQQAIQAEAAARGITVRFIEADYTFDRSEIAVTQLLRTADVPTAIIASNDLMALGALAALRREKADEIALISWDDSVLCQFASPTITALDRFPDEQGRTSARLLLGLVEGKPLGPQSPRRSKLVVRRTSRAVTPLIARLAN